MVEIKDKSGNVVLIIHDWTAPRPKCPGDYPGHWFELPDGEGALIHSDRVAKALQKFYEDNF